MKRVDTARKNIGNKTLIWIVAFFSGVAGLVYEVLWFREFALRLGNTAQASALVLAAIFGGLAIGNYAGGRGTNRSSRPLRGYAAVELGMSLCGIGVLFFREGGGSFTLPVLFFLLVGTAILMGCTLPLLLQSIPTENRKLGREGSTLYGMNTAGGMFGAAFGGLVFPMLIGIRGSYLVAIALNLTLAVVTAWMANKGVYGGSRKGQEIGRLTGLKHQTLSPSSILLLAALSGMGTLALEVLWTRMFSLVFQNSVYSFSLILILILLSLALSAAWVGLLTRKGGDPIRILWRSMSVVAISIPVGAWAFVQVSQLESLFSGASPTGYVLKMILLTASLLFPAMISAGMVLPLCWVIDRRLKQVEGWQMGSILSLNTLWGVLGAMSAGFILLPQFGLWPSLGMISTGYAIGAIITVRSLSDRKNHSHYPGLVTAAGLVFSVLLLWPSLPIQQLKPGEKLLYLEQGAEAQVAVVQQRSGGRELKVNNSYRLGSSAAEVEERRMGQIPLLLHPEPKSVAFVGLATGITASAVYDHPVEDVTLIELLPEVVRAAAWFESENRSILKDPRWKLVIADGRIAIPKGDKPLDVIISDLFVPWHAGTSALYSLEYYQDAADRLAQEGIYAQWLPLYQMSMREFQIIVKTFGHAFPHVQLWRGNFSPEFPIVALIGSKKPLVMDRERIASRLNALKDHRDTADPFLSTTDDMMLFFGGGLEKNDPLFQDGYLNTDDHPIIEYLAPISHIAKKRLDGPELADLFVRVAQNEDRWENHALAGSRLFQAAVTAAQRQFDQRVVYLRRASELVKGSKRLDEISRALKVAQPVSGSTGFQSK